MSRQLLDYAVAVTTPFTKEGDFDDKSVPALIQYYVNDLKFPGLLISGSTGEQHCLSIQERKQLYNLVHANVPEGYPVYAGVAAFKTKDAIELAQAAEKAGLSGIMLGVPPYRTPTQSELEGYVQDVSSSTNLPIFVYNNPSSNGCLIEPETFQRIVQSCKNVVGIKEVGNPEIVLQIKSLLKENAKQLNFFTGYDVEFIRKCTKFGYTSITSIHANVFPKEIQEMVSSVLENDLDRASTILEELKPKIDIIEKGGLLQSIKFILRERGLPAGYCPAPLVEPSDEVKKLLKEFV